MQNYTLITELNNYCNTNNILFLYGDYFYGSAGVVHGVAVDKLVLLTDLIPSPVFSSNAPSITKLTYTGRLLLGRKAESTGTMATLDETMLQKNLNRLQDLWTLWEIHLTSFLCDKGFTCKVNESMQLINFMSENIDYVGCTITLEA